MVNDVHLNLRDCCLLQEISAAVVEGNDQVTGHIISTTIGGKNGDPKQVGTNIQIDMRLYFHYIYIHELKNAITFFYYFLKPHPGFLTLVLSSELPYV